MYVLSGVISLRQFRFVSVAMPVTLPCFVTVEPTHLQSEDHQSTKEKRYYDTALCFNSRFETLLAMRVKLIEELQDCVPNTVVFNVGYFEGQQHSKISIVTGEDLNAMYSRHPKGEITLWCDGSSPAVGQEASYEHGKRKREDVAVSTSRRQEKEEEVDAAFKELKEK